MISKKEIPATLDPVAFVGALVLAPLQVALLFCWALFIPIAAVYFGAIPYLIFGTPVLLWMVTRYPLDFSHFAVGGWLALFLFAIFALATGLLRPDLNLDELVPLYLFGIIFAPGWFVTFAALYRRFYRPIAR